MVETSDTQLIENLNVALAERDPGDGALNDLFEFFDESERFLRFHHPDIQNPATPLADPDEGSREFGLVLYLLDNPTPAVTDWIEGDAVARIIWDTLKEAQKAENLATTKLTPEDYNLLLAKPFIGGDGTIYGTATYEQLDLHPGWLLSAINYVMNVLVPDAVHCFETSPYAGPLTASGKDGPLIAIIGDWGTGCYETGPAQQIMNEVRSHNPDYIIHLGDVYYAGTDRRTEPGEEHQNFLDLWGSSPAKTAFTLNSNHEMYGNGSHLFGGSGIVDVALGKATPFAHQNQTTYFALDFGPWIILGLDSAYYADAANGLHMYMYGAIGKEGSGTEKRHMQQSDWIGGLDLTDKKIIVMTHHNPIEYTGKKSKSNVLLNQVESALGRMPDYWYWGHVHLGAAYNQDAYCAPTWGRCIGHSAIPFGIPTGLVGEDTQDYCSQTINLNIAGGFRALNGYMMIQPKKDGTIMEAFYELDSPKKPAWEN